MLECHDIHKRFSDIEVLGGVDLVVSAGEIVSIVGPSGAGKTTLLQILGTLMEPDRGEVTIEGQLVASLSTRQIAELRNRRIGFVFQFHHLLPEFTAIENVMIPGLIANRRKAEVRAEALKLLSTVGLAERVEHKPAAMSGGEQQRVAVARALINNPAIIFADEPSGNLDTASRDALHSLFFDLRAQRGQSFLIVTHDNELAARSDRKITMCDGLISE